MSGAIFFSKLPVLVFSNSSDQFTLDTDAPDFAIGMELSAGDDAIDDVSFTFVTSKSTY